MHKPATLFSIWLVMTAVAVFVANAAVSSVRSAVTDTPSSLGLPVVTTQFSTTDRPDPRLLRPPPVGGIAGNDDRGAVSAQSVATTPLSTAADNVDATAAATAIATADPAPTVTTTTTEAPTSETTTYNTEGGWVTIRVSGNEVFLEGAGPNQGWKVNTEKTGPLSVEVKFTRTEEEITFKAHMEQGKLEVKIEE